MSSVNETTVIVVLSLGLVFLAIAACTLAWVMCWKAQSKLMWFHGAGQSLANHQLEMAKLEVRKKEVEVEQVRTELETARVNKSAQPVHMGQKLA